METQNVYPKPSKDGFSFLNENDELMKIETIMYENKKEAKRVYLSDGRTAIIRELSAQEMEHTKRLMDDDKESQDLAIIAIASRALKIDDKAITFEEVKGMKARDWVKIKKATADLNF